MYQLFKGYVRSKNKKCTETFKNKSTDQLRSLHDVQDLPEYAGILNDNAVLVDIDDHKESEILMQIVEDMQLNCRVYETRRGKHFLFLNNDSVKRNWIKKPLACGLKSDGKLGCRTSYSILKFDGKEREIIYDIEVDEEYQVIPKWLLPIRGKRDFLTMKEGDGRNQELFNYILTLQSAGFSKEECRQTIEIINKYVLKDPLDDKEIETILRDEAFQKPIFFDGTKFLHDKFAKFLISEHNIIKIGGVLHYFDDGVYVPANIEKLMIEHISSLKQNQRKEVLSYLCAYIGNDAPVSSANYIAFKNGIYNLTTDELEPFTPDKIITNKINWDYDPAAYSKLADDVLNRLACGDENVRSLLDELIGYTFYRRNELRKCFLLKGKRHNGKSTFLDMIAHLLGENNISSLDLSDLSHEYKLAGLFGKLCNIGDDIEDEYIPSVGIFKKVVSGDRVNANVKFSAPIEFNPYCKLIFSGNTIPRLGRGRDSDAIIDRIVIIPFNASFDVDSEGFTPFIKYQLRDADCMQYLVRIGIEGLQRVLKNNAFTTNEQIKHEIADYEESLNPIITFFTEMGDSMEHEAVNKCYRRYTEFCIDNSLKPISNIEFSKRVKEHYKYAVKVRKIGGKSVRMFFKEGD